MSQLHRCKWFHSFISNSWRENTTYPSVHIVHFHPFQPMDFLPFPGLFCIAWCFWPSSLFLSIHSGLESGKQICDFKDNSWSVRVLKWSICGAVSSNHVCFLLVRAERQNSLVFRQSVSAVNTENVSHRLYCCPANIEEEKDRSIPPVWVLFHQACCSKKEFAMKIDLDLCMWGVRELAENWATPGNEGAVDHCSQKNEMDLS